MSNKDTPLHKKLSAGFFGFRIKRRRITILLILLILGMGVMGITSIPKESAPQINLGLVSVTTFYPGASPEDVDELITSKIEDQIEDVDGIKKIESTSSTSFSQIIITLDDGFEANAVLNDIKSEVDKVTLPTDVEDASVENITTDSNNMFSLIIYAPKGEGVDKTLKNKAKEIKSLMEGNPDVAKIRIEGEDNYDIRVVVNKNKAEGIGISLNTIAQSINSFVSNIPLGNYQIDKSRYDYRIDKTIDNKKDLYQVLIPTPNGSVSLQSLATIEDHYDEERNKYYGAYNKTGFSYVAIAFDKPSKVIDIQAASQRTMDAIQEIMLTPGFSEIEYAYTNNASNAIKESNGAVIESGTGTIILIFICVFLFVGFKEAIIATLSIPLAFFITFFVLQKLGYTMNFLTNFSLIVTFGIAIDTIIVILEGSSEKMKMGFSPYSSALLTVHEYRTALISGTATTCAVFLPLFVLPGVMGKYLSNIPITIFITLIGALLVSLLINPAVGYLINKNKKKYILGDENEFLHEEEKILLKLDREGKIEGSEEKGRRYRFFDKLGNAYQTLMRKMIYSSRLVKVGIFVGPIIALILSFMLPVGFTMFPESEAELIMVGVTGPAGSHLSYFDAYNERIENTLASYPEIKQYTYSVAGNNLNITIDLTNKDLRSKNKEKNSFELQEDILKDFVFLEQEGMKIDLAAQSGGPPGGKAVGIELVAQNLNSFTQLQKVAEDFETFFIEQEETIGVVNGNQKTAGQFVFSFKKPVLESLGITPGELIGPINAALNGTKAGTLTADYDDHDIRVVYDEYTDEVSPSQVENLVLTTSVGEIRVGDVASYQLESNINAINRKDGKILITIGADLKSGITAADLNPKIISYADSYDFPDGVSYAMGGENEENAELMAAMGVGFVLAIFLIFMVLLLQFNSFRMPMFVFYSVVMGLLGAMLGLWMTGNPMSLAFMIGFFALTGIVVNDAIVFIDRVNTNIVRGMDKKEALINAGKARLSPILLTTVTTILGLLSVTQQDEFFAGLGYTIMFGLFFGSMMTLFVTPVIYDLFVSSKKVERMRETK